MAKITTEVIESMLSTLNNPQKDWSPMAAWTWLDTHMDDLKVVLQRALLYTPAKTTEWTCDEYNIWRRHFEGFILAVYESRSCTHVVVLDEFGRTVYDYLQAVSIDQGKLISEQQVNVIIAQREIAAKSLRGSHESSTDKKTR